MVVSSYRIEGTILERALELKLPISDVCRSAVLEAVIRGERLNLAGEAYERDMSACETELKRKYGVGA